MTDTYRGHEIHLSPSGYSYECPDLELSAPTRIELETAIKIVETGSPYIEGRGFPRYRREGQ